MKKYFSATLVTILFGTIDAIAQNPATWTFSIKKIDTKNYEVRITGTLDGDWHTYSQYTPAGGPVPTRIDFIKNPLVTLIGKPKEVGKLEEHFEPLFGVMVKQFGSAVTFIQNVQLKTPVKTAISGNVYFMVCNDEECMPPQKQAFSITLN